MTDPASPLWWILVQFAACTAMILLAGVRLSRYGDVIAEKTGLGGTWVGIVGLATVTSLPELVTGASSILVFDVADIAAGDAIGSCMFNLVILALLDARNPVPLSARIHQGHVLSAGFGILQLGLASMAMLAAASVPSLGWVGLPSLVFIAVYLLAMRTIVTFERVRLSQLAEAISGEVRYRDITLRRAIALYSGAAAVLVAAATYLPGVGEQLAARTGLGESLVGSLFIAASTSLPEIVVSGAAARMGAMDMAAANLFGSNLFNVAVLGFDDLLYTRGVLLADVSSAHQVTASAAMTMTAVAIIGLTFRAGRKRYRLSWDSLAMLTIYVLAFLLLGALS
jgi:cation:H+ antiporter